MQYMSAPTGAAPANGRYGGAPAQPQRQSPRAALAWWWRYTAPPDAATNSPFAAREAVRRCRMGSALLLLVASVALLVLLASLGLDAAGAVHMPMFVLYVSAGALAFCLLALPITRLGRATIAGLLLVGLLDASAALAQINQPRSTDTAMLTAFLVCAVLVTFAFLPPIGLLMVALTNTALAAALLLEVRVGMNLTVLALPAAIQWIAATIAFLYAATVREAYRVVCTEAGAADSEWRFAAERSMAMQEDIHRMQMALAEALGGKLDVRVPAARDPQLADLGAQISRLLAWFQRFAADSRQLQQVREDAEKAIVALNALRAGAEPEWPELRGTPLDALVDALNGVTNWSDEPLPMPKPSTPLPQPTPPHARAPRITIPVASSGLLLGERGESASKVRTLLTAFAGGRRDFSHASLIAADLTDQDLPGINLSGSHLIGAALADADLSDADLSGAILTRADLSGAHLSGATLAEARLVGAQLATAALSGADCTRADLRDANLAGADLRNAQLVHANLDAAQLSKADLYGANLTDAGLRRAQLPSATLIATTLQRAHLEGAKLTAAFLGMANLREASLLDADLHAADLSDADCTGASLAGADLTGANLTGTDLTDADLSGTDLRGAILSGVNLTGARLNGAIFEDAQVAHTHSETVVG